MRIEEALDVLRDVAVGTQGSATTKYREAVRVIEGVFQQGLNAALWELSGRLRMECAKLEAFLLEQGYEKGASGAWKPRVNEDAYAPKFFAEERKRKRAEDALLAYGFSLHQSHPGDEGDWLAPNTGIHRLHELKQEKEKFRLAASVLCGAHIGIPQRQCPICALHVEKGRTERLQEHLEEENEHVQNARDAAAAWEGRAHAQKNLAREYATLLEEVGSVVKVTVSPGTKAPMETHWIEMMDVPHIADVLRRFRELQRQGS